MVLSEQPVHRVRDGQCVLMRIKRTGCTAWTRPHHTVQLAM
jgi:hypothetical protein